MSLLSLFLMLVLFCLAIWAVQRIVAAFEIPAPIGQLIYVVVVIVAVLYLIAALGGSTALPRLR